MAKKKVDPLVNKGGRMERKALYAFLQRLIRKHVHPPTGDEHDRIVQAAKSAVIQDLLRFVYGRVPRTWKRPGGLGR